MTEALDVLCSELDLSVLSDWDVHADGPLLQVFALGAKAAPREGLRGFVLSPWFPSEADLADYCREHFQQIVDEGAPE